MNTISTSSRILIMTVVLLGPCVAAERPATPAPEETVELSPFIVSTATETGYAATNSLDGSRLNTALRDTPGAMSVFTKDFLDDIAATNLEEILRYDLSAEMSFGDDDPGGAGAQAGPTCSWSWRTTARRATATRCSARIPTSAPTSTTACPVAA